MDELRDWVVAAQNGDREAFMQILRRFQDMAYGIAYAMLGDAGLAQDAAQEAFIEAHLSLSTLREPAAFPGWFRRVVVKYSDRELRSQKPTVPLGEFLVFQTGDEPVAAAEMMESKQAVHRAISELPETQRQIVTLFYLRDYSQKEIGEFLELPVSTIKKQLFLARKKLKGRLEAMVETQIRSNRPSHTDAFVDKVQYVLALTSGDLDRVKAMVERRPDLLEARFGQRISREGAWPPASYSALHWAAAVNDRALLEFLLARQSNVNLTDNSGMTPLHVAVWRRQEAALRQILAAGADPNAVTSEGHTPLHLAAMRNDGGAAKVLLEAAAQADIQDKSGRTPMDWSILKNAQSVIDLLAHGEKLRVDTKSPAPVRLTAGSVLETGIKAIDLFAPFFPGGQHGILTPLPNVGRLVLLGELVRRMATLYDAHTVCFGLEDDTFIAKDLLFGFREAGVHDVVSVIFARADDALQKRLQAFERALASVNELRHEGRSVIFLAHSQVAGYEELVTQLKTISTQDPDITIVYFGDETVGAEPEPLADLAAVVTFDVNRAKQNLYPAVDPINSGSRLLQNGNFGELHRKIATEARRLLRRYQDLRPIIESRGVDLLPKTEDLKIVERARRLDRFLTQPFHCAEPWTNLPGVHVSLRETLDGCRAILQGECDDIPEESFFFVGNLDTAREKARGIQTKGSDQKS